MTVFGRILSLAAVFHEYVPLALWCVCWSRFGLFSSFSSSSSEYDSSAETMASVSGNISPTSDLSSFSLMYDVL